MSNITVQKWDSPRQNSENLVLDWHFSNEKLEETTYAELIITSHKHTTNVHSYF